MNVIIIKIEPLHPGKSQTCTGFVEMFKFVDGKARENGGRKVIMTTPTTKNFNCCQPSYASVSFRCL